MDAIGDFTFLRLDRPPDRATTQWEVRAVPGIDGNALWDTGIRGEPFTVRSEAVALNFVVGRTFLPGYQALIAAGPVPVWFGTEEPEQLYKVLKVSHVGPGVLAVPRVHVANDATWYTALVFCEWELLPIDPFISPP